MRDRSRMQENKEVGITVLCIWNGSFTSLKLVSWCSELNRWFGDSVVTLGTGWLIFLYGWLIWMFVSLNVICYGTCGRWLHILLHRGSMQVQINDIVSFITLLHILKLPFHIFWLVFDLWHAVLGVVFSRWWQVVLAAVCSKPFFLTCLKCLSLSVTRFASETAWSFLADNLSPCCDKHDG